MLMSFCQLGTKITNHKYEYQLDRTSHYTYLVFRSHILASFKPCFMIIVYVTIPSFIYLNTTPQVAKLNSLSCLKHYMSLST